MGDYLFCVRKYCIFTNNYQLYIYRCKTRDFYHIIGEMHYKTFEHIERIDVMEYTEEREKYWTEHGYKIRTWESADVMGETCEELANEIKKAFYEEFDELIPSIMADRIDSIVNKVIKGEKQ